MRVSPGSEQARMAPQGLSTIPSATHFHLRSEGDSTRCALNIFITFYFSCVELLVSMMPSTEIRCHPCSDKVFVTPCIGVSTGARPSSPRGIGHV